MNTRKLSGREWIFLALLFLGITVHEIATLPHGSDWGGDFSQYINHARNIVEGRPYTSTGFLYDPTSMHAPPNYPPVVPLLLAPIWARTGIETYYFWMCIPEIILFAASCVFAYILARRFLPEPWAGAVALLCATNYLTTAAHAVIGSDWPYQGLSMGLLVLFFWMQDRKFDESQPWLAGAALGFGMLVCIETRAIGVALPLAFGVTELLAQRKIRKYSIAAAVTLVIGYLLIKKALNYDTSSYSDQFLFQPLVYVKYGFRHLISLLTYTWMNGYSKPLRLLVAVLVAPASLIGIWQAWRRPTIVEWYSLVVLGVDSLYSANDRYLMPLAPFYLIWTLIGIKWLYDRAPVSVKRPALAGLAALIALNCGLMSWSRNHGPDPAGPALPTFQQVVKYIRENTAPDARLLSWNPRLFALYTRRPSAVYHFENNTELLAKDIRTKKIDYVIVYPADQGDRDWFIPSLQPLTSHMEPVLHNSDFTVYRVTQRD